MQCWHSNELEKPSPLEIKIRQKFCSMTDFPFERVVDEFKHVKDKLPPELPLQARPQLERLQVPCFNPAACYQFPCAIFLDQLHMSAYWRSYNA